MDNQPLTSNVPNEPLDPPTKKMHGRFHVFIDGVEHVLIGTLELPLAVVAKTGVTTKIDGTTVKLGGEDPE
jgi:hypothetical protein